MESEGRRIMRPKFVVFLILVSAITASLTTQAMSSTTRQQVTFRCDGEPSLNTDWAGDDDVLVRGALGKWRCRSLDSLLPRLLTGYYPDGHPVYGPLTVTDDDGGTGTDAS